MLRFGLIRVKTRKKYTVRKDGTKVFGPYKGSKENGGRPIMVVRKKDGSSTSTNAARYKYESKRGKLPKNVDVDHKDNGGRAGRDGVKNLRAIKKSANIAKENKRRVGKK